MGETNKQVRVDNWGIFFLQRLQLFFNRTDYCDLTLQFEGNVQLKVHRLVMNACTEYFNILEQTCEVVDGNTIIMPDDLQADVILPIVNFMYTGMLEFQMSIYDKLYRTADIMNIPILLKLLDAQKKPLPPLPKSQTKKAQPTYNLHGKKITPRVENDLPATLPGRKLPVWKRKSIPTPPAVTTTHYYPESKKTPQDPLAIFDNTPKPTRFEWPEDEISSTFNLMENSFDDISYTSKPLLTQDDELRASTSFEEVKYTPNSTKKSKDFNQAIDIEEVKSYVKEQKIRSDLTEYYDEDDPDNYLENVNIEKESKRKASKPISPIHTKRVRFSVSEKENKEAKINVTSSGKAADMDHTKIISEVLKKYPHLVKKNKNIRLKILAKSPTKIDIPKANTVKPAPAKVKVHVASPKDSPKGKVTTGDLTKGPEEGPWVCSKCSINDEHVEFVLYYLYRKHMTDVHNEKFDSRMCKFCGHQSNKHNMLMYHQYTRHGIKPPAAYNFPRCNRCPYIALTENLLIKHNLNHTKFDLQCAECKVAFNNQASLSSHMQITNHSGKSGRHSYDCQYCTKRYHSGSNLFSHIKMVHRDEARRDGIVSIDEKDEVDDEQIEDESEEYIVPLQEEDPKGEKIKIISDIKVPVSKSGTASQNTQQITTTTTTAQRVVSSASAIDTGSIATSLGLVDIVVLDENQQYILHNDQQLVAQQTLGSEQREYIIPEMTEPHTFAQAQNINDVMTSLHNSDIASTDELVMVLTDHDYNDGNNEILSNENSNIVVLYSHPVDGQQNQFITSQGNIMLNSQTGMLEIRNNDPHGIETSQDSQIESIEMIQREINSHSSNQKTEYVTAVPTSSSFEGPLTQNTVILENDFSNEQLIQTKEPEQDNHTIETETEEIDVNRMIKLGEKRVVENLEEDMQGEVLVMNDCLSNQEEPMEIDEECTEPVNQNVDHDIVHHEETFQTEAQSKTPHEEQEEEEEGEPETSSKSMPEIEIEAQTQTSEYEDQSEVHVAESNQQEVVEETHEEMTTFTDTPTEEVTVEEHAHETSVDESCINQEEVLESQEIVGEIAAPEEAESALVETESEMQTQEVENVVSEVQEQHVVEDVNGEIGKCEENEDVAMAESTRVEEEQVVGAETQECHQEISVEAESVNDVPENHEIQVGEETMQGESEEHVEVEECNVHSEQEQIVEMRENEPAEIENEAREIENETGETENETGEMENEPVEIENEVGEIANEPEEGENETVQNNDEAIEIEVDNQNKDQCNQSEEETLQIEEQHTEIEEETAQIQEDTAQVEEVEEHIEVLTPCQMEESASPTEEVNSQTEEVTSHIDESSIQNESIDENFKDGQEDTSQTSDKMQLEEHDAVSAVSSADENSQSQDSHTSQSSSRQEELINEYKKSTSQATKISILNDWEDTEDSQQSDNVTKKAELTVNKLIHDWDDDDEEGHESES